MNTPNPRADLIRELVNELATTAGDSVQDVDQEFRRNSDNRRAIRQLAEDTSEAVLNRGWDFIDAGEPLPPMSLLADHLAEVAADHVLDFAEKWPEYGDYPTLEQLARDVRLELIELGGEYEHLHSHRAEEEAPR